MRIGRAAYQSHAMKNDAPVRIVIGVDDTPDARAAVEAVANRSWTHGSEARIICVNCRMSPSWTSKSVPHAAGIIEGHQEEARKKQNMLDEAAGILRASGLMTSAEMINGDPQRVLLEEAARVHADCIFVGSRGISGIIERLRLDSVSLGVATKASCSVEIVWTT